MDEHQRQMWQRMLEAVARFRVTRVDLGKLVQDLRGLYVEADPHDRDVRSGFEAAWSVLDSENELRTEPWAPPGIATEESLERALDAFSDLVEGVLGADTRPDHR